MKIIILGAGVIGVTTAYILRERGHEVTVIERNSESAKETSFANGGQLSYSHAEPWANPGNIKKIIEWFGKDDAPLVFKFTTELKMWLWGLKFLSQCTTSKSNFNTANMLRLALYSREILKEIENKKKLEYNHLAKGILHIFNDEKSLLTSEKQASYQATLGCPYEVWNIKKCVEREGALKHSQDKIFGGIYYPYDQSGDIHLFTTQMSEKLKNNGVEFLYNTSIEGIESNGDKIVGIKTNRGNIHGDSYVVATGSYAPLLLDPIGINLPIYPMKGYSISIPIRANDNAPYISITDQSKKLVYSRLGNILRVAGTAEFAKYDASIREKRITSLKKSAKELFPDGGDFEKATSWACLRPQTPSGAPLLGRTKYSNLFLNTGHGTLGWTLSFGSARIVSDIVENKNPEIDLTGLTL